MAASQWILISVVVGFTAFAALCDLRTKRLPNWLTLPAFLAGLTFHVVHGAVDQGLGGAWDGLLFAMGGFATGFGALLVLWLVGGGGGGDVKLMGALGAWLGTMLTLQVFVVSAVLVLLFAVGVLAYHSLRMGVSYTRKHYWSPAESGGTDQNDALAQTNGHRWMMPYGVPVALSTWLVLVASLLVEQG